MDLNENFTLFAEKVALAEGQRARVERQLDRLRKFAAEDSILSQYTFSPPELQGSYAHGTIVRPLASDAVFDVDVLLPLDLQQLAADRWSGDLAATWDDVHERLKLRYAANVRKRNRCIRIAYADGFRVDLVPGQPVTNNFQGEFFIIDREKGRVVKTNPLAYNAWVEDLDQRMGGLFTPAVRILKRWRDLKVRGPNSPKSIFLTTLAGTAYAKYSLTRGLPLLSPTEMTLQNVVVDLGMAMPHYLRFLGPASLPIPGSPNEDLLARQSSETLGLFSQRLDAFNERAAKAVVQRNEEYALSHWQQVLGTEFPIYA